MTLLAGKTHLDNSTKSADVRTPTLAEFVIDRENHLSVPLDGAAPRERCSLQVEQDRADTTLVTVFYPPCEVF